MMTLMRPEQANQNQRDTLTDEIEADNMTKFIVAREGSELAAALRARGWVARVGWRSTTERGEPIWHLRFEIPSVENCQTRSS